MALTESKDRNVKAKKSVIRNFDVVAGLNIYEGALIGFAGSTGFVGPFETTIYQRFIGVAANEIIALSADSTDKPLAVELFQIEKFDLGVSIDNEDVGRGVYALTDDSFVLAPVPSRLVGVIFQHISDNVFWVYVSGPTL